MLAVANVKEQWEWQMDRIVFTRQGGSQWRWNELSHVLSGSERLDQLHRTGAADSGKFGQHAAQLYNRT